MKSYKECITRLVQEYYHAYMQDLMPRWNVEAAQMVAFIFNKDLEAVLTDAKKEWRKI